MNGNTTPTPRQGIVAVHSVNYENIVERRLKWNQK